MGFWIFCLAMNLLLPVIMLVFGRLFQTKPPKTINGLFGYRTARSMKSQEAWDFAHRTCGRLWFKLGLVLLMGSIVPVERALKQNFDDFGRKR